MGWLFRAVLTFLTLAILLAIVAIPSLFLQDVPRLAASLPLSPQDVAATRQLVRDIRSASSSDAVLRTDAAQLNSAIRLGARFIDGFRGRVVVRPSDVLGEISLPVPWWNEQKWLNISGRAPAFEGSLVLSQVTVGSTDLPPAFALAMARIGANLSLGNHVGDKVLNAASAMQISEDDLIFRIALDDVGKNGVMRSTFATLRGREMPTPEEIESYHLQIRAAMSDGTLSQTGSFLPYLRFTLSAALRDSTTQTLPNAYTAAIFGLAKACGAKDFAMIVGRLAFDVASFNDWPTSCDAVTFNGRIDSRRHFITSAALQAASNRGFAVSVGEFKELYDTISGAGGFDFTDLAANLSGISLSNFLMAEPPEAWPVLLTRLEAENDVIVDFGGIPPLMPEATFKVQFGDVDSSRYKALLSEIEDRIKKLGLYEAR